MNEKYWLDKVTNVIKNLVDRVEILENDKTASEQIIKELTAKLNKQQNNSNLTFSDIVKDQKQNKTNITQLVMTSKISNELNQNKKNENNIIISGIVESNENNKDEKLKHDKSQIIELKIMDENLNETNVKIRLPRRNEQERIVESKLRDE